MADNPFPSFKRPAHLLPHAARLLNGGGFIAPNPEPVLSRIRASILVNMMHYRAFMDHVWPCDSNVSHDEVHRLILRAMALDVQDQKIKNRFIGVGEDPYEPQDLASLYKYLAGARIEDICKGIGGDQMKELVAARASFVLCYFKPGSSAHANPSAESVKEALSHKMIWQRYIRKRQFQMPDEETLRISKTESVSSVYKKELTLLECRLLKESVDKICSEYTAGWTQAPATQAPRATKKQRVTGGEAATTATCTTSDTDSRVRKAPASTTSATDRQLRAKDRETAKSNASTLQELPFTGIHVQNSDLPSQVPLLKTAGSRNKKDGKAQPTLAAPGSATASSVAEPVPAAVQNVSDGVQVSSGGAEKQAEDVNIQNGDVAQINEGAHECDQGVDQYDVANDQGNDGADVQNVDARVMAEDRAAREKALALLLEQTKLLKDTSLRHHAQRNAATSQRIDAEMAMQKRHDHDEQTMKELHDSDAAARADQGATMKELHARREQGLKELHARRKQGLKELHARQDQELKELHARQEQELKEIYARQEQKLEEIYARQEQKLEEQHVRDDAARADARAKMEELRARQNQELKERHVLNEAAHADACAMMKTEDASMANQMELIQALIAKM